VFDDNYIRIDLLPVQGSDVDILGPKQMQVAPADYTQLYRSLLAALPGMWSSLDLPNVARSCSGQDYYYTAPQWQTARRHANHNKFALTQTSSDLGE